MEKKEMVEALYAEYSQDKYKVKKYQRPGIYCIKINGQIVYVGKSVDMLKRIVAHQIEITNCSKSSSNKYKVLNEAYKRADCQIEFDVLYKSRKRNLQRIEDDIGEAEAKYINEIKPALNFQVPTVGNYKHYTVNKTAKEITLDKLMGKFL